MLISAASEEIESVVYFAANTIQGFPGVILNVITEKVKWLGYCHFRKDHFKGNNFGLNL